MTHCITFQPHFIHLQFNCRFGEQAGKELKFQNVSHFSAKYQRKWILATPNGDTDTGNMQEAGKGIFQPHVAKKNKQTNKNKNKTEEKT